MYCAQVDFKSAFQNTELTNYEIYMKAPKGLKLHRTLQGTKQAAHDFHYHKVDKLLTTYGLISVSYTHLTLPTIYSV